MEPAQVGGELQAESQEPWEQLDHRYSWDDLVLPERELELLRTIPGKLRRHVHSRNGRKPGVTVLFSGQSGTGKTMAAQILGAELGLPIFEVDLGTASFQNRAESRRLLDRVFAAAESCEGVLVFERIAILDEGSFASGSRRRTVDVDLSYLLKLSEEYPGLVIFARRPARRLDPELAERFDAMIAFPVPRSKASREIWQMLLPANARVSTADLEYLTSSLRLTGGAIHSCCVAAAADAAEEGTRVGMQHLARALEEQARRDIWRMLLPANARVSTPDLEYLTSSFRLTGGAIRSCCSAAAADAAEGGTPVGMQHLARALEQRYRALNPDEPTRHALELLVTTVEWEDAVLASDTRTAALAGGKRTVAVARRERTAGAAWSEQAAAAAWSEQTAAIARSERNAAMATPTFSGSSRGIAANRRRPHLRPAVTAPRWRLHAPRWRLHAPRWRLHAPRWRLHAPRWRLHAPRWRLHAPRWRRPEPQWPRRRLPRPRWPYAVTELRERLADRKSRRALAAPRPRVAKPRWSIAAARRAALLVVGGTLAAAALGFLVARTTGGGTAVAALDKHASAGLLRVSFPSGWRREPPPAAVQLGVTDELALAPASSAGGSLVIGRAQTADPSLLPQSLLATLRSTPSGQVVTLGGARFYRYLNLSPLGRHSSESLYALPTTVGTILGVCASNTPSPSFTINCERVLGTVKLASGSVLPAGPNSSYAAALNQVIATLNTARTTAGSQLRGARGPTALANSANQLAAADSQAGSALLSLNASAGPAAAANSAVATALLTTADEYRALARAAENNDVSGYQAADAALKRSTQAVNSAFAELGKFGYRVG
jgi:ATPase family associated with various cellular activities (AAA)